MIWDNMKLFDQYMGYVIAISTAMLAGVWWLMNNILTNKSEIKLLKHQNDITNKLLDEMLMKILYARNGRVCSNMC